MVDEYGHRQIILNEIIYHIQDVNAILKEDAFTKTPNGMKRRKMTTEGWQLCIQWKYGSTDWVSLKDINKSYPIELSYYANIIKIDDEPMYAWWVPYVQKNIEVIRSKVKSKYWQRTHKYVLQLPKSVNDSYELDKEDKKNLWRGGTEEDMEKIKDTVAESTTSPKNLVRYQEIDLHIIVYIKLGGKFR